MVSYPKIDTLFKRDPDTHSLITDELRHPAINLVKKWVVTEKIDGMNIRIIFEPGGDVHIRGRTDRADVPEDLLDYIANDINVGGLLAAVPDYWREAGFTLYGEGYGAGIQKGGGYSAEKRFVLFDVKVGDGERGWQDDKMVTNVAAAAGFPRAPILGIAPLEQIIMIVQNGFYSALAEADEHDAEGIVARPLYPLYDERGKRLILKLKTKDFDEPSGRSIAPVGEPQACLPSGTP